MFGTLGIENGRGSDREQGFSDTLNLNFGMDTGYLCFPTKESLIHKFISLWVIFLTWVLESNSTLCAFRAISLSTEPFPEPMGVDLGVTQYVCFCLCTMLQKISGEISQPTYSNYNLCLQLRESHLVKINGILFWNSKWEDH